MRIHRHKINERKSGRNKFQKGLHYYVRRFLHIYGKNEKELFSGHLEIRFATYDIKDHFIGWQFHVGNAGSETPFDGYVMFMGLSIYWGISSGRNLAHKLTTSDKHKYDGRDISIRIHDGRLYTKFWAPSDRWERGEMARWRDRSYVINPVELIWGPKKYTYQDIGKVEQMIVLPEGAYGVVTTLQKQTLKRTKSKKIINETHVLDVDAKKGIPTHYDSSGGWKGDDTWGFGVAIPNVRKDWHIDAQWLIAAWILEYRGRTGYRYSEEFMQEMSHEYGVKL